MPPILDPQTLQKLKAKDAGALRAVVGDHAGPLLAGAYGLGFRESEAEELVQAVFVAFLDALDRFEGRSAVRTYLFGILYRKAKEAWRARKKEEAVDPADAVFERRFDARGHWSSPPMSPEEEALNREAGRLIESCSEGLSQAQRAAFHLREVERLSTAEICKALDVTATHLGVLLFRARAKLRECLEKRWEAPA